MNGDVGLDDMRKILDAVVAINSETNYYNLLNIILQKMRDVTNCDAGTLYILDGGKLHFKIMHNDQLNIYKLKDDDINLPPVVLNENNIENVCAYCAIKKELINIADVYENAEFNFQGPRNYDKLTGYRTCSMLVYPLQDIANDVVGVIQLINAKDRTTGSVVKFNEALHDPLMSLSKIAAVMLSNIHYTEEIKEQFNSFVKIMSAAIDERTPYNANHTKMVAKYSERFAEYLGNRFVPGEPLYFDQNRKEQLVMAAFMHDIGKIVTPLEVMNKPTRLGPHLDDIKQKLEIKKLQETVAFLRGTGASTQEEYDAAIERLNETYRLINEVNEAPFVPKEKLDLLTEMADISYVNDAGASEPILSEYEWKALKIQKGTLTDDEFKIMKEHVTVTGRLLENITFNRYYKDVKIWAAQHHELLDGTGYPGRLKDLPPEVCILTIIDIFDALTSSDRPYKKAMPYEKALQILKSMVDEGKLHAELVELFSQSLVWEITAFPCK